MDIILEAFSCECIIEVVVVLYEQMYGKSDVACSIVQIDFKFGLNFLHVKVIMFMYIK